MKQLEMAVYTWDRTGGDKQCLGNNDQNGYKMQLHHFLISHNAQGGNESETIQMLL